MRLSHAVTADKVVLSLRCALAVAAALQASGAGASSTCLDDECPGDALVSAGQSIEYFVSDKITGAAIEDGMVLPEDSWLFVNARATAFGQCALRCLDCTSLPCECFDAPPYERTVNTIHFGVDIGSDAQHGSYSLGGCSGKDPATNRITYRHVLDCRDQETSSGAPKDSLLSSPGAYRYTFVNSINAYLGFCPLPPDSVSTSMTVYAAETVNDDCNLQVGKGAGVASRAAVAAETDWTLGGTLGVEFHAAPQQPDRAKAGSQLRADLGPCVRHEGRGRQRRDVQGH